MTSAENNQLIAELARDIVAQTAPQELPLSRYRLLCDDRRFAGNQAAV